jgi:type IV pilus assembly protein PilO
MAIGTSLEQLRNFDLNDLDLQNLGSWPTVAKATVMVIALILVLGGGYYFFLTEKQSELERAALRERDLRQEFETKSFRAANLEAYREQKIEMERQFEGLLRQLPGDTEVPGLLEDITRQALSNELTIGSIDLQDERRTEFYMELPIDIVVEGNYHRLGAFVSGVANLSRIVTLHDFTIEPHGSPEQLRMKILAKTYRYLDEGR